MLETVHGAAKRLSKISTCAKFSTWAFECAYYYSHYYVAHHVALQESYPVDPCAGHVASTKADAGPLNRIAAEQGRALIVFASSCSKLLYCGVFLSSPCFSVECFFQVFAALLKSA